MREGDLNPQRGLKVVDINVEGRRRLIVFIAKLVVGLREALAEGGTIDVRKERFFVSLTQRLYCDIHFGRHAAGDRKVSINVILDGRIAEVDLRVMTVLFLRQIKGELVVNGEVVIAAALFGITVIVICGVTFLTMITRKTFCAAKTLSCLGIA